MARPPNAPTGPDTPLFGDASSSDSRPIASEGAAARPVDVPPMFARHLGSPPDTLPPAPPSSTEPTRTAPVPLGTPSPPQRGRPTPRPRVTSRGVVVTAEEGRRSDLSRAALVFSGCTFVAAVIAAAGLVLQQRGAAGPSHAPTTVAPLPSSPPPPPVSSAPNARPSSAGAPSPPRPAAPPDTARVAPATSAPRAPEGSAADAGAAVSPPDEHAAAAGSAPAPSAGAAPPIDGHPGGRDVRAATAAINTRLEACVAQHGREGRHARLAVTYEGATGRATSVRFYGHYFDGRPIAACIEQAVRDVAVPRFTDREWSWDYTLRVR